MRIWPVLLDSTPRYLNGERTSLLRMPLYDGCVAAHLSRILIASTTLPVTAVAPPDADIDAYGAELSAAAAITRSCSPQHFADLLADMDLSDMLLLIDPIHLAVAPNDLTQLVATHEREPHLAHHLVVHDRPSGGTRERISLDASGRIRAIQRHYESATWPFLRGVGATILPVASAVVGDRLTPRGLIALRRELATRGVPSRDVPMREGSYRLDTKAGLLAANEQSVIAASAHGPVYIGGGHVIDPSARIVGAVVMQAGVTVGANATIIGPTLLAAGATVEANAIVAHAVAGPAATVAAGTTVQNTVWLDAWAGPDWIEERGRGAFTDRLARPRALTAREPDHTAPRPYLSVKRVIDAVAAAIGLTLLSPMLSGIALLIWLKRDGPVFYGDEREGVGGRVFKCWKFRTMSRGADSKQLQLRAAAGVDGPHFKMAADPRVTRIGRILRSTNLDEIPQLFNVLIGEMSLVGPRPSPFRENQICVPWRNARISVRPGITGMWQVCRHDREDGDFHQWIEYDLLYVRHLSLMLDLKILAATVLTLGGKATHVDPALLVPRVERRAA